MVYVAFSVAVQNLIYDILLKPVLRKVAISMFTQILP